MYLDGLLGAIDMSFVIEMELQTDKDVSFEEINECLMYSHRKTLLVPYTSQIIRGKQKHHINYFVDFLPDYKSVEHLKKRLNTILLSLGIVIEELYITSTVLN